MTLRDYLQNNADINVAIGTELGEQFLYFGPAADATSIQARFDENYNAIPKRRRVYLEILERRASEGEGSNDILSWAESVHELYIRILLDEELSENYISPLDRPVVEDYDRTCDDYRAVIIQGTEYGSFWFPDEYITVHG